MMRLIAYIILFSLLFVVPLQKQDIASLKPIQAVFMDEETGKVCLYTDTEDVGWGSTVSEALQDMKKRSEGIVYLDTAEFLLVTENSVRYLKEIAGYLKENVKVCLWEMEESIVAAAQYMQAHKVGITIRKYLQGGSLVHLPKINEKSEKST